MKERETGKVLLKRDPREEYYLKGSLEPDSESEVAAVRLLCAVIRHFEDDAVRHARAPGNTWRETSRLIGEAEAFKRCAEFLEAVAEGRDEQ